MPGIFGDASSPFDESVEKVTQETLTQENWALMMDICDKVKVDGSKGAKLCLLAVKKRMNHRDPHVVLLALSLLDCLWNNCGGPLQREISSKEFLSQLNYMSTSSNRVIGEKTRALVKKWAENECKKDPSLALVEGLYKELADGGYTFEDHGGEKRKQTTFSNDPNVVNSEEEEAAIARAIALSLNDVGSAAHQNGSSRRTISSTNHYPSVNELLQQSPQPSKLTVAKPARVLYDFEAVEENELSMNVGDIVTVLDDSDQNWWKGELRGRQGLFPASFVSFDLNVKNTLESGGQMSRRVEEPPSEPQPAIPPVQINEDVLMKCIQLLEDCDPTGEVPDPPELAFYEHMSVNQAPLIDQRLAQIDKQHNMLAQIDIAIRDVLASYDSAVQQVAGQQVQYNIPTSQPQSGGMQQPAASTTQTPTPNTNALPQ